VAGHMDPLAVVSMMEPTAGARVATNHSVTAAGRSTEAVAFQTDHHAGTFAASKVLRNATVPGFAMVAATLPTRMMAPSVGHNAVMLAAEALHIS